MDISSAGRTVGNKCGKNVLFTSAAASPVVSVVEFLPLRPGLRPQSYPDSKHDENSMVTNLL